jgi:hypothetical protein
MSSSWHVSALFAATIESTTLYTRLRATDSIYSNNLGQMTDLLNVFGKQTIANIEMSPIAPSESVQNEGDGQSKQTNSRGEPMSDAYLHSVDDESESRSQKGIMSLEVDLSSPQDLRLNGIRRSKKRYVFSQVQTYRGPKIEETDKDNFTTARFGMTRRPKFHR